jgi:4-amino-4-deoxy-L-arabinose transferase-like glycosyltransferase
MYSNTAAAETDNRLRKNRLLNADFFIGAWIMLFALAMLPNLNNAYPLKGDESFYTVSAMNMIDRGEPLAPWYFGAYRFNKPILPYLVVAGSYLLFGVGMWSARLMILVITCGMLFITYRCSVLLFKNKEKAVLATTMLSACYLCVGFARIAMTEPILTFFALCALYLYVSMFERRSHLFFKGMLGALFTALAFMTKGPAGLFPFIAAIVYAAVSGDGDRRRLLWAIINPPTLGVIVLIAAPWYLYIREMYPEVLQQNLQTENGVYHNLFNPVRIIVRFFFYLGVLILVHAPFTIAATVSFIKKRERPQGTITYLLWFCGVYLFVFVFLVDMHKERYLTVIAPAVSMITATYLHSGKWKRWVKIACIISMVQIMLYNCYPLFSHEALRALVRTWRTEYDGTLGLPLEPKHAGWCRLYAHDKRMAPPDSADFLIVTDRDRETRADWKIVATEKRLSSLHFKGGKPVIRYRIYHLLQRPDEL